MTSTNPTIDNAAFVLDALFEQSTDGLIVYDRSMVVTKANSAAEKLLEQSDLVGRSCREVFGCGACEAACGVTLGLSEPLVNRMSSVHIHNTKGNRVALVSTTPILGPDGQLRGAIATFRGVSDPVLPSKNHEVVAESTRMRELSIFTRRVAASEAATVLLEGENGTGKDLIARSIHNNSLRSAGPFIAINCAAVPETLIESELFGFEKGAFTDARQQKRGLFEVADKGTLFLDEIGEVPLVVQAKLLRALEERCIRRLGGLRDIEIDVRLIAATNRNLREAVKEGAFRQDLYYRLNVISIEIPPLRDRREDILPLSRFFIEQYNTKFKRQIEGLTQEAELALLSHDWPGNVRELRNAIERAMILEECSLISVKNLPMAARQDYSAIATAVAAAAVPAEGMSLEHHEKMLLERALQRAGGNQTQAARLLSITRDTLRYKMKKHGLK